MNGDSIDTSPEACAVACMLVSNPRGYLRKDGDGWQKRVNDLIRALRERLNVSDASVKYKNGALRDGANMIEKLRPDLERSLSEGLSGSGLTDADLASMIDLLRSVSVS